MSPTNYERTEQGDDPLCRRGRLTDEELLYLADWDCESTRVASMATELIALRARVAKLEAALAKISTAARKDTSLVPPDPLLAFIVGVVDAALSPTPDAENGEKP